MCPVTTETQKSRARIAPRLPYAIQFRKRQYSFPFFSCVMTLSFWFLFCLASWGACLTLDSSHVEVVVPLFSGLYSKRRKLTCMRRYLIEKIGVITLIFTRSCNLSAVFQFWPSLVFSCVVPACVHTTPLTLAACSPHRAGLESVMVASAFQIIIANWATR